MDLYVDEYGYQTNPPDKTSGISATLQDAYMQRGAYLAWRDKRIKLLGQYLWYDEPKVNGSYSTWQSGVRFNNGKAKPSFKHFRIPFALDAQHNLLWGQVRDGGRHRVDGPAAQEGLEPLVDHRQAEHRLARLLDGQAQAQGRLRLPLPGREDGQLRPDALRPRLPAVAYRRPRVRSSRRPSTRRPSWRNPSCSYSLVSHTRRPAIPSAVSSEKARGTNMSFA